VDADETALCAPGVLDDANAWNPFGCIRDAGDDDELGRRRSECRGNPVDDAYAADRV
jgi:hypothetical protein